MSEVYWQNVTGAWNTGADWSTGQPPGTLDIAVLDSSIHQTVTYALTGTSSLAGLIINTDTLLLTGSGALTVADGAVMQFSAPLQIGGGDTLTISGSSMWADTEIDGPGTLVTSGTTSLASDNLSINGGLTWINSGTVLGGIEETYIDYDQRSSTLANTIINQAGGTFDIDSSSWFTNYSIGGAAPDLFNNAGLLETPYNSYLDFDPTLNNTGTLSVTGFNSQIALSGGGTLGGTIVVGAMSQLEFSAGTYALTGTVVGSGRLVFEGGYVTFAPDSLAATLSNTIIIGGRSVTFPNVSESLLGPLDLNGGTLGIVSGQTISVSGPLAWSAGDVAGPGTLVTSGTTTLGPYITGSETVDGAQIDGGLTWVNSGTVVDSSAYSYIDENQSSSTLANTIINQAGGTFDFTSSAGSAFYNYSNGSVAPDIFSNAGLLEDTASGDVIFDATLLNTGTVSATQGALYLNAGAALGGTMGGNGATGVVVLYDGGFVTSGTATIADEGTVGGLQLAGGETWTVSGTALDAGLLLLGNNNGESGTLAIAQGGTFSLTTTDAAIIASGGAIISNAGALIKSGSSGDDVIATSISNTGSIEVAGGTLDLAGNISGSGGFTIDAGAVLEFASTPASGEVVTFNGSSATLKLDSPTAFVGTITGLTATDTIDLAGLSASGGVVSGNSLIISLTGGGTLAYAVTDLPNGEVLQASSDLHGGTNLVGTENGVPVFVVPTTDTLDVSLATLIPVRLGESGNTTGESFTVTLSDRSGMLSANGAGVSGAGTTSLTITGALAQVNAALATLTDTDNVAGAETIVLNATDGFGNVAPTAQLGVMVNGLPPAPVTIGSGNDTLTLSVSEDAWQGDAQFTIAVDGQQVGGSLTTSASRAAGQVQLFNVLGDFGLASYTVTVTFLNDLYDGSGFDRNLYVAGAALNGTTIANSALALFWDGDASFRFDGPPTLPPVTIGSGTDMLTLSMSEDAWQGDAQFTVAVDGQQIGGTLTTSASHAAGQAQLFNVLGDFGPSEHTVTVTFLNDLYDAPGLDRNLYVEGATLNGATIANSTIAFFWDGPSGFGFDGTAPASSNTGQVFMLTTGVDRVAGGTEDDTVVATDATLSAGDSIDGGGGTNTLVLQGDGTFNLAAPSQLANIQVITAQEGQPADTVGSTHFAGQNQIVDLRAGLDATVNVNAANINPDNPTAATITIVGAANADVINLGTGNDVVIVGGSQERVYGGGGADTIEVSAATIGAKIDGGSGSSTLEVTGGGSAVMGASITDITTVLLASTPGKMSFIANAINGLTIDDTSHGADTLTAGGLNQTITGGSGYDTLVGYYGGGTTFLGTTATMANDTIDFVESNGKIDLTNVQFLANPSVTYVANKNQDSGVLSVSDGTNSVKLILTGLFYPTFQTRPDGGIGTIITLNT